MDGGDELEELLLGPDVDPTLGVPFLPARVLPDPHDGSHVAPLVQVTLIARTPINIIYKT